MKKYFKHILILNLVFLFNCEDAIDIEQVGRLTPEVTFETVSDLEQGLYGLYTLHDNFYEVALAANYTDEVAEGIGGGGQGRTGGHIFQLDATNGGVASVWVGKYQEINYANRILEAATLVEATDAAEQAKKDDILGQVYALRAFSHFQLLSYFTTDYADDNALGVIKLDYVPSIADQSLRSTNGEVFALIEDDLSKAQSLVEDQSNTELVSKDFILALRARMAAYRQDYVLAETLATDLLNRYPLANRTNYPLVFEDLSDREVIFKLDRYLNGPYDDQPASASFGTTGWLGGIFAFVNSTIGGGAYYEFNRSLFNLFDPNDIRYETFLHPSSEVSPNYQTTADYFNDDILIVGKYRGIPGQPLLQDQKIFRSSEMLLIIAEARIADNDLPGAAARIKQLRDARFATVQPLPTYGTQQEAYAALLDERRVEFAFEGHRWKDIKRLGVRAGKGVERDPLDASTFNMIATLPATDYRFTLPIPVAEFEANPQLRTQQNPGY